VRDRADVPTCIECGREVVDPREDGRCYYHGKLWDQLMDRPEPKRSGPPREFIADGSRLVEVKEWDTPT
jgi:hypothetical protein